MIKHYKKITWLLSATSFLFAVFALTNIYYAGGLTASGADLANTLYIVTAVTVIFPLSAFAFYLMQYYYYRDKTTKGKLISATWLLLFAILFLVAKPIDASSNFLSEKRLISFITGLIYSAICITHAIQVFKK